MKKIAVVYYSGTGNTEALANALVEGAQESGASVKVISAGMFSSDMLDSYDAFAFGCPAMGSEALEDEVFEPMFESLLEHLAGRKVALFGSYGWGDGEWMRLWKETTVESGAILAAEPVIALDTPDQNALEEAKALGVALAR
ncbi:MULTISPECIES: flavodoxin [Sphaerochaeta]|jgi:flavodoxin short chain|uniref:Flavodoxin n=2 Tax=root TaxID=1 RepID=A0ABY4D5F3_9SPIR|nr:MULTISPECIES: flavodoxin [Sphaerochaeta]MDT3359783.1 flavodoxin [Spirochaetota bacterium]NLA98438.1 flavodoxin [Spirochaetales bacterium]MDD2396048.1 flavodoxin [Sphaerochaeta sp.]MDD3424254.1 flavodoxin [Sphaerochaeta sp.]MDD3455851.1 flavodoxin [Sphaerochaeta sp.]